ncbi:helix-turn-helix domain-containing protein [Saccharomonospora xinjiangensis]|uniref:ArsR/SmtB family transcription factor n=1 Tax=Saccharomonospora xinjiangensis TaxID=75294 RepID=UPI00106FC034|nr:helix-turn-helix domain-containing protein [Saccharomonospora xinjiangensis]QBQ62102.1 Helix-turn-helix domain protein [Saccharomonospora xinjiangensis]
MGSHTDLAAVAALLADRTRARFCMVLLDGRAWTARELAVDAGVSPSTASEHLTKLVGGGILVERRQGRHRYVQLAGDQVAGLIEGLVAHADLTAASRRRPQGLRAVTASAALARGRTCYDHLAGALGVAITDAMIGRGLIEVSLGCSLTEDGATWFGDVLGVPRSDLHRAGRPAAKACLDWTERRSHLAGVAGAHLCRSLLARHWVKRIGTGRAVRLTQDGAVALRDLLDADLDAALDTALDTDLHAE